MNYSRKHIKKIAYNKLCGYHNRIVYLGQTVRTICSVVENNCKALQQQ